MLSITVRQRKPALGKDLTILTSTTVPFVMTPSCVYIGDWGFFFTPIIGRQNVAFNWKVTKVCNKHSKLSQRPSWIRWKIEYEPRISSTGYSYLVYIHCNFSMSQLVKLQTM